MSVQEDGGGRVLELRMECGMCGAAVVYFSPLPYGFTTGDVEARRGMFTRMVNAGGWGKVKRDGGEAAVCGACWVGICSQAGAQASSALPV